MLRKNKGQGVIEYLLVVALVGVAAIAVLQLIQHSANYRFAQVANALQGKAKNDGLSQMNTVKSYHYKKKDLSNFMSGAALKSSQKSEKK